MGVNASDFDIPLFVPVNILNILDVRLSNYYPPSTKRYKNGLGTSTTFYGRS